MAERRCEAKPLRYARKKAAPQLGKSVVVPAVDKNFRVHVHDPGYRTLTVPIDPYDTDDIRKFLKKTADQWPRPYETRVACRLMEAFALNLPSHDFIGLSSVIPPQRFFEPRRTITVGLWFPAAIADRLTALKQSRPAYRKLTDTEAVRIFMIEAVARYIRPILNTIDPDVELARVQQSPAQETVVKQEEIKLLRSVNAELELKISAMTHDCCRLEKQITVLQRKLTETENHQWQP